MSALEIYLFTRLHSINNIIEITLFFSIIATISTSIGLFVSKINAEDQFNRYGEEDKDYKAWLRWNGIWRNIFTKSSIVLVISTILYVAIPSQKEAAAIYLIPKITNSEAAKELSNLPVNAAKILNLKLNEYIEELQPIPPKSK